MLAVAPWTWARCGLASPGDDALWPSCSGRGKFNEFKVGTSELGEFLRLAAPGHPQSNKDEAAGTESGELYAGSEMFACVALHERT